MKSEVAADAAVRKHGGTNALWIVLPLGKFSSDKLGRLNCSCNTFVLTLTLELSQMPTILQVTFVFELDGHGCCRLHIGRLYLGFELREQDGACSTKCWRKFLLQTVA